jgi:UDP-N-acetylmuramoyl-L-alanyl-D-glutamate--2,6-diaminopimelate ligase
MTTLRAIIDELQQRGLLVAAESDAADINGITDDSRAVRRGDLYCAWRGTTRDSHDFLAGAVQNGANAVLVERAVAGVAVPQVIVKDGRRAAAIAANVVFGKPAERLVVTGVTGTNGKTTTAWIPPRAARRASPRSRAAGGSSATAAGSRDRSSQPPASRHSSAGRHATSR